MELLTQRARVLKRPSYRSVTSRCTMKVHASIRIMAAELAAAHGRGSRRCERPMRETANPGASRPASPAGRSTQSVTSMTSTLTRRPSRRGPESFLRVTKCALDAPVGFKIRNSQTQCKACLSAATVHFTMSSSWWKQSETGNHLPGFLA